MIWIFSLSFDDNSSSCSNNHKHNLASIISDSSHLPTKAPKAKSLSKGIEPNLIDLLDNPVMTGMKAIKFPGLPKELGKKPPYIVTIRIQPGEETANSRVWLELPG